MADSARAGKPENFEFPTESHFGYFEMVGLVILGILTIFLNKKDPGSH
jgi:hypothetical protein